MDHARVRRWRWVCGARRRPAARVGRACPLRGATSQVPPLLPEVEAGRESLPGVRFVGKVAMMRGGITSREAKEGAAVFAAIAIGILCAYAAGIEVPTWLRGSAATYAGAHVVLVAIGARFTRPVAGVPPCPGCGKPMRISGHDCVCGYVGGYKARIDH